MATVEAQAQAAPSGSPDRSPAPRRTRAEAGSDEPGSQPPPPASQSASSTPPAGPAGNRNVAAQRLQKELMDLMTADDGPAGVSAFPKDDNLFRWVATMAGPADTPFAGIDFQLTVTFSDQYPYKPPRVRFDTPCFHPNVELTSGAICLDVLSDQWSAVMSVSTVLLSLQALLATPNLSSPLNRAAAELWAADPAAVPAQVRRHATRSNSTNNPPPVKKP